MTREELLRKIESIRPADEGALTLAVQRQSKLAKPPGSLGGLEDIAIRLAGILGPEWAKTGAGDAAEGAAADRAGDESANGNARDGAAAIGRGCVIVFCADNGVADQGVSSAPQSVTRAQTINFTRRLTGVGTLTESFGSELLIVDMGVKDPIPEALYDDVPLRDTRRIIDRRIRPGTWDISLGPAMEREEALRAIAAGFEMAEAAARAGFGILGVGEMGIGNTTTSSAVLSALTGEPAEVTCGRGGGINDESFAVKCGIVDRITEMDRAEGGLLDRLDGVGAAARPEDRFDQVLDLLARCGGFDLCGMTGAFLGAACRKVPVVIDGLISAVAALAAAAIAPEAKDYMFASHRSAEPGYTLAVERMGLDPFLDLGMRLGEGSGCPIAFAVIRGAWDVMNHMATFEEAAINDDYLEEIRGGGCF